MWAQAVAAAVGVWLMAAPGVLGYEGSPAVVDRIAGPIVASAGTIALWQVTRALRWVHLPAGIWLLFAPWIFDYPPMAILNSAACGLCLAGCSFVRGRTDRPVGGGWRAVFRP
jgi:hypothetical protein